jgi:hypothetical protein
MRISKLSAKGEVAPVYTMIAYGVWRDSSTSLTPALDRDGQLCALASVPLEKENPAHTEQELKWTPELIWTIWRRERA